MSDDNFADHPLDAGRVKELFTAKDGSYRFARWDEPISPVVFGTDDVTLGHLKSAIHQTIVSAGHVMAASEPEQSVNLMIFFCQDWDELDVVPNIDKMLPDFESLKASLKGSNANQYRSFTFNEDNGAIKFCILLLRYDDTMAQTPIQTLACGQITQCLLLWGDTAFEHDSPIAIVPENGLCVIKPPLAAVMQGAYAHNMPPSATDDSHALRLAARGGVILETMVDDASA